MKKFYLSVLLSVLLTFVFFSCTTTRSIENENIDTTAVFPKNNSPYNPKKQKVIIYNVNKDISKNPPLVAGKTYKFHIEGTSKYCIIAPTNNSINTWNVIENDGSNVFETQITIPTDALRVPVAFSSSDRRFETAFADIPVKDNYVPQIISDAENTKRIIADVPVFSSKEQITGGNFYEICAGYNPKNYLNVAFNNGTKWLTYPIEKNEDGYFQKIIQAPADATKMICCFHDNAYWTSGGFTLSVTKSPSKYPVLIQNEDENILYIQAPMLDNNTKLETGKFYTINVGPFENNYFSISGVKKVDEKDTTIFWELLQNNGTGNASSSFFIPQTDGTMYLNGRKNSEEWECNIIQFDLQPSKKPYKFSTTDDYASLRKYKTSKPDSRVIKYMESINAREMGKTDPDAVISMTVDEINKIQKDEYEKVKLLHDAVWYLVSYDSDSLAAGIDLPQDYKSVIGRGMSVCAGFSAVFSQFCKVAGIKEISINGYARGIGKFNESWKPTDDPTQTNHAWNIVRIDNLWYLIDSTWDSGHTRNGKRDDYYSNAYIFVKPEEFIHTHYPSNNSDFQLLNKPYTPEEFSKLPYAKPN